MTQDSGASIAVLGPGPVILEQAHALVAAGIPIFPVFGVRVTWNAVDPVKGPAEWVCTCGRDYDDHKPGKHPATAHGHLDAALHNDHEIVRIWGNGDKNLAYRTGNGIVVIDVDEKNGGLDTLDEWEQWTGFSLHETLTCRTGGGGLHLVYRHGVKPIMTRPGVLPGIDIKGEGGYCVANGSRHISGHMYEWVDPNVPIAMVNAPMWGWLGDTGSGRGGTGLETPGNYDYTQGAVAGQRDAFFNDLAFRSRKENLDYEEAWRRQRSAWENTEQPVGDVYPWESALNKLTRVWQRVEPDADIRVARDVLSRWNAARDAGRAARLGNRTIITNGSGNGETL